ncbi:AAA family ATPase [soil metagenome]
MTTQPYAELRETHTAVVVLVGDMAYKFKKPVDLDFLDFSTPALREAACSREVSLNRRMAADVYLGLAHLEQPDCTPEPVVVMRRMPDDRRLSTLVTRGVPVAAEVRAMARQLAVFHASAERHPILQLAASRDALLGRWRDSLEQVRALDVLDPTVVEQVTERVEAFLAGRAPLLDRRIAAGLVLDGHGDLQADDIFCLPDGPRAIDCLEFDDALRHVDQLDDAAFLAMDLEHLGAPDLASDFLDAYLEFSGDPAPEALKHHYVAYRAFVRAKVSCLRTHQGDAGSREVADGYARIALQHLRLGTVRLVLVGGLPGTGKSTLAAMLADKHGYVLLSSDRLRKELAGLSPDTPAPAAYGQGLYAPGSTDATYAELVHRAELLLASGESVVIDASWTDAHRRGAARAAARATHADLAEIRCYAPTRITVQRMRERHAGASDADDIIAARMATIENGWPSATVIETTGTLEQSLLDASAVLDAPDAFGFRAS